NNRIPGTSVGINNYADIKVSGPYRNRSLFIEFKDTDGKVILSQTLSFPEPGK
ncbi:MAG: hypothetical protein HKN16_04170, partial [Saprospiraceae bacterium]|nr:hypothetical protein [Saprospiraceae bacterium]